MVTTNTNIETESGCCCQAKAQSSSCKSKENTLEKVSHNQQLIIEGAGCASCVGKIEGALKATLGVVSAEMNFADRTVTVSGAAKTEELIKAVESVGYNAKPIEIGRAHV